MNDMVSVIAISGSILSGILQVIFHGTSLSRCKTIDCLCMKCERDVLQNEDLYDTSRDKNNNE